MGKQPLNIFQQAQIAEKGQKLDITKEQNLDITKDQNLAQFTDLNHGEILENYIKTTKQPKEKKPVIIKKKWYMIEQDNRILVFLKYMERLLSIITSIIYAQMSAFESSDGKIEKDMYNIEIVFFFMIVTKFLTKTDKENTLVKIGQKYISQGSFIYDAFAIFPFQVLFQSNHFYLTKAIRIMYILMLIDNKYIISKLNNYSKKKTAHCALDHPNDIINDHSKIQQMILLRYSLNALRIMVIILFSGYFSGIFIYILFDVTESEFIDIYEINYYSPGERTTLFWYFSFTTISTVGFGDFHPKSNFDRVFFTLYMFLGVMVFQYVLGKYQEVLMAQWKFTQDIEDDEGLQSFFMLLKRFNNNNDINSKFRDDMKAYFSIKWKTDTNSAILTDTDQAIFEQLPIKTQLKLYTRFIMRDLWEQFRKEFTFPNFSCKLKNSFLSLEEDFAYQQFMIKIFRSLAPLNYDSYRVIYTELDDINLIQFVVDGQYDIGYTINKNMHLKVRRFSGSIIGLYEVSYGLRMRFLMRTKGPVKALFLRKKEWRQIENDFPQLFGYIKQNCFYEYVIFQNKMLKFKEKDLETYRRRADFEHIITMVDNPVRAQPEEPVVEEIPQNVQDLEKKVKNLAHATILTANKLQQQFFAERLKIAEIKAANDRLREENRKLDGHSSNRTIGVNASVISEIYFGSQLSQRSNIGLMPQERSILESQPQTERNSQRYLIQSQQYKL